MGEKLTFSAILWKEGKLQIAWCPELDIASQGKGVEEALANLHEAIDLYLEDEDAKIPTSRSAPSEYVTRISMSLSSVCSPRA